MIQFKGHLRLRSTLPLFLLLLFLLLPSLVVSRRRGEIEQTAVNESRNSARENIRRLEKRESTINGSGSLIARWPREKQPFPQSVDYAAGIKRHRRVANGAVGIAWRTTGLVEPFPVALHQQSTNTAAAKRDLHYKQYHHGRRARGAAASDSRTISENEISRQKKRLKGPFLPGQVNELSRTTTEEESEKSKITMLPRPFVTPSITYAGMTLPEPFLHSAHRERGRAFGLSNFLIKNRPPMYPRSFGFVKVSENGKVENMQSEESMDVSFASVKLPKTIVNNLRDELSKGYALFHQVVEDGANDVFVEADTPKLPSFPENSLMEKPINDVAISTTAEESTDDNDDKSDWESNEKLQREIVIKNEDHEDVKSRREILDISGDRLESEYEFGYRVIDHRTSSDFGHEESRRDRMTNGRYRVLLPDGRIQRVEYTVDSEGYHADVSYARPELDA